MLEQSYWIAGIVVAVVAVTGLFLYKNSRTRVSNQQNVNVNGDGNAVSQSTNVQSDENNKT